MTMSLLRWSIALVLGLGAFGLLTSLAHGGHPGLPAWAALGLGAAELGAACGLLFRRAIRPAGFAMLGVLVIAAGLHIALGAVPPASYLVYAAAIWLIVHDRPEQAFGPGRSGGTERAA